MTTFGRTFGIFGLVLLGLFTTSARADTPAEVEARLLRDLRFLTSDDCEGRGITTKGINLAAEYVAREFQKSGLKPAGPDGTYYQNFTLVTSVKAGPNNQLVLQGPLGQAVALESGKHFNPAGLSVSGKAEAGLVFAGYGITSDDPKYDDYAGLDVTGKVVVILSGTPRRGHRYADLFAGDGRGSPASSLRAKVENAARHKAAGVLIIADRPGTSRFRSESLPRVTATLRDGAPFTLPVGHLRRDEFDPVLFSATGAYLARFEEQIDADLRPRGAALSGWTCRLQTDLAHNLLPVKNVVGVMEGRGPLAKETVVIGAHYDHVGFGSRGRFGGGGTSGPGAPGGVGAPQTESSGNTIHRGADDNASGTVTLMEVARRFGAAKDAPGRRILFIAFTAEESGLLGSAHYCRQPLFPLADTVAMVNMDMVGRLQDNKLLVGGLASATQFQALMEELNKKHAFNVWKEPSGQGPSDHASFYQQNIPVFKFFTGFHEQYHRPTDRVETINVPGIRRIAGLVGDVAAELRAMPSRPTYAKTGSFNRTTTLWAGAPATGILPDYRDSKEGVLLEGVVSNTPAARAGLKKGDRLRALAGQPVKNVETFLTQARTLKPGSTVEATVDREGKPTKVELQLARAPAPPADMRFGFLADFTDIKDGILLTDVPMNSAAAKAGLRKGDRIVAMDGDQFADQLAYLNLARMLQPGDVVAMTVNREGKQLQVQVTAAEAPRVGKGGFGGGRGPGGGFGAFADPADQKEGALVARVLDDSSAAATGLKASDRVTAVNGKPVKDAAAFRELVGGLRSGDKVELQVVREGKSVKLQGAVK